VKPLHVHAILPPRLRAYDAPPTALTFASRSPAAASEAELVGEAFEAGIKSGIKVSDSQRPSQTLNPHEGTEPNLSD
jgi:hypothetical protein